MAELAVTGTFVGVGGAVIVSEVPELAEHSETTEIPASLLSCLTALMGVMWTGGMMNQDWCEVTPVGEMWEEDVTRLGEGTWAMRLGMAGMGLLSKSSVSFLIKFNLTTLSCLRAQSMDHLASWMSSSSASVR